MLLKYLLLGIALMLLINVYNGYTRDEDEGFTNYTDINSPTRNFLLAETHPVKKNISLTDNIHSSVDNYTTKLNYNKWSTPENGSCLMNELCGAMYDGKNIENPQFNPASLHSKGRVNLYNYSS